MPITPKKPAELLGQWLLDESGARLFVHALTRQGVLLYDEQGQQRVVPLHAWPADLRELDTAEDTGHRDLIALLVGGGGGSHADRLFSLSREVGVDIQWHISMEIKTPRIIPIEAELLILVTSHMNHNTWDRYMEQARERGIPVAKVQSAGYQALLVEQMRRLQLPIKEGFGAELPLVPSGYWEATEDPDGWYWVIASETITPIPGPPSPRTMPDSSDTALALLLVGLSRFS